MFIGHLRTGNTIQMFLYKDGCYVCPDCPKKHVSWYHYQSSPMAERYIFGANKGGIQKRSGHVSVMSSLLGSVRRASS